MTNKPMLSVERELLQSALNAVEYLALRGDDIGLSNEPVAKELRDLLDKQSCGACRGCDNGCKLDRESPQVEPASPHQGEPLVCVELVENKINGGMHIVKWDNLGKLKEGIHKLYAEQPEPLKIGAGVTVENIGFGTEHERKPYLVFDGAGCLTEVNLIDVSMVSKRRTYSISELNEVGVRVERPAPAPDSRVDNGITYPNGLSRPAYCAAPVAHESECTSCDGSGEYTDAIGDWRGYCTCPAGVEAEGLKGLMP